MKNKIKRIYIILFIFFIVSIITIGFIFYQISLYIKADEKIHLHIAKNFAKKEAKDRVENVITLLNSIENKKSKKDIAFKFIKNFNKTHKFEYIFVYKYLNSNKYLGIMLINPNRKDLIGKKVLLHKKDIKNNLYRMEMKRAVLDNRGKFVEYYYKMPNNVISKKITYIKYYKPLNLLIASGVYIKPLKQEIKKAFLYKIIESFIITLILIIILYIFIIFGVVTYTKKLINLIEKYNQELEERVKEEIEKNRQKDLQLIKQSRLATMGQIISMIAHQWRQPLSAISNYANEILLQIMLGNLNKKELENNATKIVNLTQNLSQLINDFREFYKEDKEKSLTSLNEIFTKVQNIASASLKNYNIHFNIENNFNQKFKCFPNELAQVILNIIQNSKDAILEKNIKNPFIKVKSYNADNYIVIEIEDNAGGIPEKYKDKIFEPYFSTKSKNGTGLGLFMSKMIIEKHCNGKLYFKNTKNGVKFVIELRKDYE